MSAQTIAGGGTKPRVMQPPRKTLVAFADLQLEPSGLLIRDCTFHRHADGREWVGLPARPQLENGVHRKDPATGKGLYVPTVEIGGRDARERFQTAALAAVHALLGAES